jgi:YfiH family protein
MAKNTMSAARKILEWDLYHTIPRFERIPWLVHGFGTRRWKLEDFRAKKEWAHVFVAWLDQVHLNTIRFIARPFRIRPKADALATNRPGIILAVKTADCLPVLLVDEAGRVVAAVHSGWRGTEKRIVERAVCGLRERYGSRPETLLAALGPCIAAECYDVGPEVRERFRAAGLPTDTFRPSGQSGKYILDLRQANRLQLERLGLDPKNIFDIGACTRCDDRFHSYRRDRNTTARLWNFIGIRDRAPDGD